MLPLLPEISLALLASNELGCFVTKHFIGKEYESEIGDLGYWILEGYKSSPVSSGGG